MKKCIITALLVMCCVQMSSAMNSKASSNVVNFLRNYKNAYNKLGAVDHSNFTQALEDSRQTGFVIQQYENDLKAVHMNDFNPFKDSPEDYAGKLSDDQLNAFENRFQ